MSELPQLVDFTVSANWKSAEVQLAETDQGTWVGTCRDSVGESSIWDASKDEAIVFAITAALEACGIDIANKEGRERAQAWMDHLLNQGTTPPNNP